MSDLFVSIEGWFIDASQIAVVAPDGQRIFLRSGQRIDFRYNHAGDLVAAMRRAALTPVPHEGDD